MVTYPQVFDKAAAYLCPDDFVIPLYREVAEMLFRQKQEGEVNPARLLNSFQDSEEQRKSLPCSTRIFIWKPRRNRNRLLRIHFSGSK